MGRRYRCTIPSLLEPSDEESTCSIVKDPSIVDVVDVDSSSETTVSRDVLSPPRKAARAQSLSNTFQPPSPLSPPHRSIRSPVQLNGVLLSPRRPRVFHQHVSPRHRRRRRRGRPPSSSSNINHELVSELNQAREHRMRLETQLEDANRRLQALTVEHDTIVHGSQVPDIRNASVRSDTPSHATSKLVQHFLRSNVSPDDIVHGVMESLMSRSRCHNALNNVVISNTDVFSLSSNFFRQQMYGELKYKFRPWVCLQQLDLAATVSFRAYDTIRMIEFSEDTNQKYRRGLFYSRHKLSRLCRQLEAHASEMLPYSVTENSVKFDVTAATKFILSRYGLWDLVINKDAVKLASTVDGGDLSWNVTQVSAGLKVIDSRAIEPISGRLLFGDSGHDKVQSKYHCYPLYVVIDKDTKWLYKTHLSKFFDDLNSLEVEHSGGLEVAQCHDMCSLHKTLGVGGGMKVKLLACYCCNRHRDDLAKPMDDWCADCIRTGSTYPCFHTPVSDEGIIQRMKEEREEHLASWPHLVNLPFNGRSRLRCGNHTVGNVVPPDRDPLHIEFQPCSRMERDEQRKLFKAELLLRNQLHMMNHPTAAIKIHLQEVLLVERTFVALDFVVKARNFEEAMIRLEQALPCLLHLENRTSEALIEHLLRFGLRLREGDATSTTEFVLSVESLMNTVIFGSIGCSSHWSFPLNSNGTIGKVKFANWRARKVIEDFQLLVDVCVFGDDREAERMKWMGMVTSYRNTILVSCTYVLLSVYC
jgi:hypothetical protein